MDGSVFQRNGFAVRCSRWAMLRLIVIHSVPLCWFLYESSKAVAKIAKQNVFGLDFYLL